MSEHLFPFEKLRVWQSAREFVKEIVSVDLEIIERPVEQSLRTKIESISAQLNALRNAQLAS